MMAFEESKLYPRDREARDNARSSKTAYDLGRGRKGLGRLEPQSLRFCCGAAKSSRPCGTGLFCSHESKSHRAGGQAAGSAWCTFRTTHHRGVNIKTVLGFGTLLGAGHATCLRNHAPELVEKNDQHGVHVQKAAVPGKVGKIRVSHGNCKDEMPQLLLSNQYAHRVYTGETRQVRRRRGVGGWAVLLRGMCNRPGKEGRHGTIE